jgi:O-antigen/teichoic acid export membrane protein
MLAQIMRNQFRPVAFAATSFAISGLALPIGLLCVTRLDMGVAGILTGMLVAEALVLSARALLVRQALFGGWSTDLLRRLLRFGVPLVPVTMSFWVFTTSDRIILAKLGSFRDLGYYSAGLSLVSIFSIFAAAVGQAWSPRVYQKYEHDPAAAADFVGRSLTYFVVGIGALATFLAAFAPEAIDLITADEYAPAATVVPILAAGSVAYGTSLITSSGLTLTYRTKRLLALSLVAAVLNVALALALVPSLGMTGAALASAAGYVALTSVYLVAAQRVWPIKLEARRLGVATAALAVGTGLASVMTDAPIAARVTIPAVFAAIMLVGLGRNDTDRQLVRSIRAGFGRGARGA